MRNCSIFWSRFSRCAQAFAVEVQVVLPEIVAALQGGVVGPVIRIKEWEADQPVLYQLQDGGLSFTILQFIDVVLPKLLQVVIPTVAALHLQAQQCLNVPKLGTLKARGGSDHVTEIQKIQRRHGFQHRGSGR